MAKILVVGFDGATFKLIQPWIDEGSLPNLASMAQEGASGSLYSVIPPLSPSAWPAFYTGKYPSKTGVFAYGSVLKPGHAVETTELINASHVKSPSLWKVLSEHGYRVGVVNVPVTWPPKPVNGFLITDFLTPPDAQDYTYPPSLKDELDDYQITVDVPQHGGQMAEKLMDRDAFLKEQYRTTEKRMQNMVRLIKKYEPHFFCVNFKGVDDIQHFFWSEPAVIKEYLQLVDSYVADLVGLIQPDFVFVMSDHGFHAKVDTYFHLNSWLEQNGYLVRSRQAKGRLTQAFYALGLRLVGRFGWIRNLVPEEMKLWAITEQIHDQIDWSKTKAHATRWGVYLNQDVVSVAEREPLRRELISKLKEATDPSTGLKLFQDLYRREDLYDDGDFMHLLPEIIFHQSESYRVNPTFSGALFSSRVDHPSLEGGHVADPVGILFVTGRGIKKETRVRGAKIVDLAPTILHLMQVPIPHDLSGRVLDELFEPDSEAANRDIDYQIYSDEEKGQSEWTVDGEESVVERLRALGYIE